MKKFETLAGILQGGLVTIVRADNTERADKLAGAICRAGVQAIEVTLTTPGALRIIEDLCAKYREGDLLIGAGTVLDPETARAAIMAGARYIVCPNLNIETVKLCNRYGIPVIPGVATATEAVTAMEYGADLLKVFPGSVLGQEFIKTLRAPLPMANFIPTGGVELSNVDKWFEAGAAAVAVGGGITNAVGKNGDYEAVTRIAREFAQRVKRVKEGRKA